MPKRALIFVAVIFMIVNFSACSSQKLSDKYNEDELHSTTENLIDQMNNKDFNAVASQVDESIKDQLSADILENAWTTYFQNVGKFESISKMVFQEKDDMAIVVAVAKYAEKDVQYTITYNTDLKIMGLYMK